MPSRDLLAVDPAGASWTNAIATPRRARPEYAAPSDTIRFTRPRSSRLAGGLRQSVGRADHERGGQRERVASRREQVHDEGERPRSRRQARTVFGAPCQREEEPGKQGEGPDDVRVLGVGVEAAEELISRCRDERDPRVSEHQPGEQVHPDRAGENVQALEGDRGAQRVGNVERREDPERRVEEPGLEVQRERIPAGGKRDPPRQDPASDRGRPERRDGVVGPVEIPGEPEDARVVQSEDGQVLERQDSGRDRSSQLTRASPRPIFGRRPDLRQAGTLSHRDCLREPLTGSYSGPSPPSPESQGPGTSAAPVSDQAW